MRSLRLGPVDLWFAVLLLGIGAVELGVTGNARWPLGLAAYALAVAVLLLARRWPLAAPPLVAVVFALTPLTGFDVSQPASWLLLLAVSAFAAGLLAPPSRRLLGLASVVAELAVAYAGLSWLTDFRPSLLFGLGLILGPWGLGLALRTALVREQRAAEEHERARRALGRAREDAVRAERERIAVELNDVLVHALGAMLVQASTAADLLGCDMAAARQVLGEIADAGREALAETGRLLHVLRDDHDESGRGEPPPEAFSAGGRRIAWRDAALPAGLGIVATVEIVSHGYGLPALATCWLALTVLVARRAVPLALPATVAVILLASEPLGVPVEHLVSTELVVGFACFAAGRHARSRTWVSLAVLVPLAPLAGEAVARGDGLLVLLVFAPWAVGAALRTALARARALASASERARLEAAATAADAVARERRRIARELHDLLARSLAVMSIQASLAGDLAGVDSRSAAVAAVAEVERAGRVALEDTGRLLRLLRDGSESGTQPQPGVADLPALAEACARAGLSVELEQADLGRMPPSVDVSVYRIVEEALTNALKHAPGSGVRVRLARRTSSVAVEVVNGRASSSAGTAVASGHGLVGLRERVDLYGGTLDARSTEDGGFLLAATMPLGAAT